MTKGQKRREKERKTAVRLCLFLSFPSPNLNCLGTLAAVAAAVSSLYTRNKNRALKYANRIEKSACLPAFLLSVSSQCHRECSKYAREEALHQQQHQIQLMSKLHLHSNAVITQTEVCTGERERYTPVSVATGTTCK